jgi:hypothetical protein
MLTLEQKINYFENGLLCENDYMKDELHLYFFELQNSNFNFLNKLHSYYEIEEKIRLIVSKMYLHEHEDGLENIIENYL